MNLIVCLIIALVVAAAVLGVVRAVLALPPMANIAPYGGVIYALILLLIVLASHSIFALIILCCVPTRSKSWLDLAELKLVIPVASVELS